jgi:hypothetical protein
MVEGKRSKTFHGTPVGPRRRYFAPAAAILDDAADYFALLHPVDPPDVRVHIVWNELDRGHVLGPTVNSVIQKAWPIGRFRNCGTIGFTATFQPCSQAPLAEGELPF